MGVIIAVLNKKGENATAIGATMLRISTHEGFKTFGIASPKMARAERSIDALSYQDVSSPLVIGHASQKDFRLDKHQPTILENAALVFDGRIYPNIRGLQDAEIATRKLQGNRWESAKNLVKESDGSFAFIIAENRKIIAARDVVGVHPLYYGENQRFAALASERKALWTIGIENAKSFPPGHVALVDDEGFRFEVVKSLTQSKVRRTDMESAAKEVQKLLQQSVKERVKGSKKVAVAFSGGIDSSIIAFLAKNLGADVNMVHVSLENQPETEYAEKAAEELELPIHTYICSQKDVERVLPKVLWLVEEPDPVKISIGIPFFWAAEKTAKMNLEVLLAGQGADELFCGYRRYVNHYLQFGREKTRNIAFRDVCEMYKANFERDYKVCDFHNVELRLPFAAYQIMQLATELPLELKIERKDEGLRKLVLRRVAENIGLPRSVVEKPKKAIQYATGVSKVLRELAEREGLSIRDYLQRMFRAVFGEIGQHD